MAELVAIYLVAHQPRRLRLPAAPLPPDEGGWERRLFDDDANRRYLERIAGKCYLPVASLLAQLAGEGLRVGLSLTESLLRQLKWWLPEVRDRLLGLYALPEVEPIGVDPLHTVTMMVDAVAFRDDMARHRRRLWRLTGRVPQVSDTTEMLMGDVIAHALAGAGWGAALCDGRPGLLGWRSPAHLYRTDAGLLLLPRHPHLSDDVGYRFSDRTWEHWPLSARTYAGWIASHPGDAVVLGWDLETFGEHHWEDTGIFSFLADLPRALEGAGVESVTPGELVRRLAARAHHLPLPARPCTWAGDGDASFFFGNPAQQAVLEGMRLVWHKAQLLGDRRYREMARWLLQSDHLHCLHWYGREGPTAEVAAYFTPREWWPLGPEGIVQELQAVYRHAVAGMRRRGKEGPSLSEEEEEEEEAISPAEELIWYLLNYVHGREANPELAAQEWEAARRLVRSAWPAPVVEGWKARLPQEVWEVYDRLLAETAGDGEQGRGT